MCKIGLEWKEEWANYFCPHYVTKSSDHFQVRWKTNGHGVKVLLISAVIPQKSPTWNIGQKPSAQKLKTIFIQNSCRFLNYSFIKLHFFVSYSRKIHIIHHAKSSRSKENLYKRKYRGNFSVFMITTWPSSGKIVPTVILHLILLYRVSKYSSGLLDLLKNDYFFWFSSFWRENS